MVGDKISTCCLITCTVDAVCEKQIHVVRVFHRHEDTIKFTSTKLLTLAVIPTSLSQKTFSEHAFFLGSIWPLPNSSLNF